MYHAIFTGFPSAEATNVQIQGFFPVEKIILRVDWELKKSGYQKSEPISVHFCEVYQSHIRWWGYRKTDPEQQKTVPTPKGYKNLTFTPGLLKLFMVYGGDEGNYTICFADRRPSPPLSVGSDHRLRERSPDVRASRRCPFGFDSLLLYEMKQRPHGLCSFHGGDEGNRTPVRKYFHRIFSERSF